MRRTTVVGAVVTASFAVTLAGPSYAGWSRPFAVSDASHTNTTPVVVTAPTGRALVAWTRDERSYGTESRAVMVRGRSPGGAWQPLRRVSPTSQLASLGDVAVDDTGAAAVVWTSTSHVGRTAVFLRLITRAGVPGPVLRISTLEHHTGYAPDVALEGDGSGWVTWVQTTQGRATAMARRIAVDGTVGPRRALGTGTVTSGPALAIGPDGEGVVVWAEQGLVRGVRLRPDLPQEAPVTLGRAFGRGTSQQVQVGVDGTGTVTASWLNANAYGLGPVRAVRWQTSGAKSRPRTVTPPGHRGYTYLLRSTASGEAQLSWTEGRGGAVLRTRHLDVGLRRGPVHLLTRHVGRYTATLWPDGSGLLVWVAVRGLAPGEASYRRIGGHGRLLPGHRMIGEGAESVAALPGGRFVGVATGRTGNRSSAIYASDLR